MGRNGEFINASQKHLSVQMGAQYSAGVKKAADKASHKAFTQSNKLDWKPKLTPEDRQKAVDMHVEAAEQHRAAETSAKAAGKPENAQYHRSWASHHEGTAAKYV